MREKKNFISDKQKIALGRLLLHKEYSEAKAAASMNITIHMVRDYYMESIRAYRKTVPGIRIGFDRLREKDIEDLVNNRLYSPADLWGEEKEIYDKLCKGKHIETVKSVEKDLECLIQFGKLVLEYVKISGTKERRLIKRRRLGFHNLKQGPRLSPSAIK